MVVAMDGRSCRDVEARSAKAVIFLVPALVGQHPACQSPPPSCRLGNSALSSGTRLAPAHHHPPAQCLSGSPVDTWISGKYLGNIMSYNQRETPVSPRALHPPANHANILLGPCRALHLPRRGRLRRTRSGTCIDAAITCASKGCRETIHISERTANSTPHLAHCLTLPSASTRCLHAMDGRRWPPSLARPI